MGFRYRKSIKLGKGVRLNINKGSVSMSVGGKGARVTVNSKGRKTTTVGLPVPARAGLPADPFSNAAAPDVASDKYQPYH